MRISSFLGKIIQFYVLFIFVCKYFCVKLRITVACLLFTLHYRFLIRIKCFQGYSLLFQFCVADLWSGYLNVTKESVLSCVLCGAPLSRLFFTTRFSCQSHWGRAWQLQIFVSDNSWVVCSYSSTRTCLKCASLRCCYKSSMRQYNYLASLQR